jgi:branched-chain amino acid transport system permease protein/neutral amino acid transport system permease protein
VVELLGAVGFGLVTAAILSVSAVGFTLQYSVSNVLNLAFVSVMTASGFVSYGLISAGVTLWLAIAIASLVGGLLSALINWGIYTPFIRRGTSTFGMVIVTISTALICQNLIEAAVGPGFFSYGVATGRTLDLGGLVLTPDQVATIGVALVLMVATYLGLQYTRLGRAMRAISVNPSLARACGVDTGRVVALAWLASGVMAGAGGALLFLDTATFSVATGSYFLIVIIAAAVFGGVGSARGAFLGAVILGVATEVAGAYWIPELKDVVAFGVLIVVLLVRPRGLFSEIATLRQAVG